MEYSKSALVLKTLEGILGRDKMDEVMRAFFMKVKFTHPTTEDFLRITSEAAGRDLRPLLEPMLLGTGTVDFKVMRVRSVLRSQPEGYDLTKEPPALYAEKKKDKAQEGKAGKEDSKEKAGKKKDTNKRVYDSKVMIQRKGELVLPVDVLVTFSDGTKKKERWDGEGRYTTFTYSGPKVTKVVVDPDGLVPLDLSRLNNGWSREGERAPAGVLTEKFRVVFQGLFTLVTLGL
jgi:hypothetical protein